MKKKHGFLEIYDEVFVNTEKTFFDRNRLHGALGYLFAKMTSIQTGIMHQQVNDFGKWYLQVAFVFNTDLRKVDKLKRNELNH